MIIENLKIRNFRNYEDTYIQLQKGIHFITGKNGQGKTNLLESIYYLSCTKSHRTNDSKNVIRKNTPFFMLEANVLKNDRKFNVKCILNEEGKNLFFYHTPVKKVSDFIGTLNAVMFCPTDMNLFQSSPSVRRKFIDLELGKLSKTYTNTLNTYYKLLKERNAYLKKDSIDESYIQIIDEQMMALQITIIKQRKKFVDDMIKNSVSFYTQLSNDKTKIHCHYDSFVEYDEESKMHEQMRLKYKNNWEKDKLYKVTSVGIHKDDFIFMMNDQEVVSYASQGQKRSIVLALKLGIVKSIYLISKTYPIVLLDDVFSELDADRREQLLNLLDDDMQIFIASTDKILIKNKLIHYWYVENGSIKRLEEDS